MHSTPAAWCRFRWGCLVARCTAAKDDWTSSLQSVDYKVSHTPLAHFPCRFCWGCLVAHCSAAKNDQLPMFQPVGTSKGESLSPTSYRVLEEIARSEEQEQGTAFYNCPVCRKPQVCGVGADFARSSRLCGCGC